ncbi:DUF86 domain-containing protein [Euzebya tangerina]|uniref:HepT-like ribonuclease domain-containing protein n=1 Tax=Euzebya tangerina TaxID=591198 RepID=UPI000E31CC11|nr:HepT-like ribonuclease domain-containing protein [Euzebya tangerina]
MTRSGADIAADLLDAIEVVERLVAGGRDRFLTDRVSQYAAEAALGRIGDAAQKLIQKYPDQLPAGVPWKDIIGQRIMVDHIYHRLDYTVVWNTLTKDVPALKAALDDWEPPEE